MGGSNSIHQTKLKVIFNEKEDNKWNYLKMKKLKKLRIFQDIL